MTMFADDKPSRFYIQALEVDDEEFLQLVRHLRSVWDGIGHDLLEATAQGFGNEEWDGYLTGADVACSVADFAGEGHDYPPFLPEWHNLPQALRRAALDIAFPPEQSFGY